MALLRFTQPYIPSKFQEQGGPHQLTGTRLGCGPKEALERNLAASIRQGCTASLPQVTWPLPRYRPRLHLPGVG